MLPNTAKIVNFERMFWIPLTALKINGAHPSTPRDIYWLFRFLIMHGAFTARVYPLLGMVFSLFLPFFTILGQPHLVYLANDVDYVVNPSFFWTSIASLAGIFSVMVYNIFLSMNQNDFSLACRNGTVSIIYMVISFKYYIITINKDTITKIINMMKADYAKNMPDDARDIIFEYANRGRRHCVQWLLTTLAASIILILKHAYLELYTYITDDWKLLQLYPLTFPGIIEEYKLNPVVFPFLYVITLHYFVYASYMYMGFVPLGPMFMLHACGQLEIVKKRTLALYEDNSSVDEVEAKLKDIVKHLQYIFGLVEYIKDALKIVYELTLKGSTIILPITIYEVLGSLQRGEFSVEFVTIIFGGIFISSGPCYYSDMLMEKGEEVRLAIYSCGWETRYDHRVRKTLLMMLLRTSQPIAVRTLFRTVCLDALADVFHQSYALFSLMNAAWG